MNNKFELEKSKIEQELQLVKNKQDFEKKSIQASYNEEIRQANQIQNWKNKEKKVN